MPFFGAGIPRPCAVAAGLAAASLLIAAGGCSSSAGSSSRPATAVPAGPVSDCLKQSACFAPRQFRVAYGIQPLLDHGIDGRGETVVLLEFAAPRLALNSLAHTPSPWLANGEEVEDTEIVHAVAPEAEIRWVLISDLAGPLRQFLSRAMRSRGSSRQRGSPGPGPSPPAGSRRTRQAGRPC